jgi:putative peptide zinc metalloprotease protein
MKKALILIAAVIALSAGAPPPAGAGAGDNVVVAVNTRDDSYVYRVSLAIRRVNGQVVDATNAAVAVASCDSCQTVAISLEALLVFSDPRVFTPTNLAMAMNISCSFCQTMASAYQWAVVTGTPVHLTADGNREVAQIRRELEALRHVEISIWDLQEYVATLAARLQTVLATELVAARVFPQVGI